MAKYQKWLEPDGLICLEAWARDGLTDEQIAGKMDIGVRTLYEWKNKHSQISQSLKRGKEPVDIEVENSLLKRALGYEYEEIKEEYEHNNLTKRVVTKKEVIPDVTAQIYWLKNRKPDKWRDKREDEPDEADEADTPKIILERKNNADINT